MFVNNIYLKYTKQPFYGYTNSYSRNIMRKRSGTSLIENGRVVISYRKRDIGRQQEPYQTNCTYYYKQGLDSRAHCFDRCMNNLTEHMGKVMPSSYWNETLNFTVITPTMLIVEEYRAFHERH